MMDWDLPTRLAAGLRRPLPGRVAQARFEPEMSFGRHYGPPRGDAQPAAVLVLLYPGGDDWLVPLTMRPATMVTHAGQVSLPGGRVEPGETSRTAVLRELEEELGVPAAGVELLGSLSPLYLFVSNFLITPWVGSTAERPAFQPNLDEVSELLEVPLAHLRDPANAGCHHRRQRGIGLLARHIQWQRHRIWGATSMILGELLAVLDQLEPPSARQSA